MEKREENVKACSIVRTFKNNNWSLIQHVESNFCFAAAAAAGSVGGGAVLRVYTTNRAWILIRCSQ